MNVWQRCADKLPDEGRLIELRKPVYGRHLTTRNWRREGSVFVDLDFGCWFEVKDCGEDSWRYATDDTK